MIKFSVFLLIALSFSANAFAYIDLGTGSMLTQLIIAALAGGLIFIKDIWHKISTLFNKKRKK